MSEQSRIIQLWKEKSVAEAIFRFSCGGDSMNDTEWEFIDSNGNPLTGVEELEHYFDNEVYNAVTFYVDSNGHYNGEAGTVTVTLEGEEYEEPYFSYSKDAESEYSESHIENIEVKLTPEEAEFIRKYVENINGGSDVTFTLNYKVDCLLSDEEEDILEGLNESVGTFVDEAEPETDYEGELDEWYEYTTDLDGEEGVPQFKEGEPNTLLVQKRFTTTVFKKDND